MHCPRCGYDGGPSGESCDAVVDGSFVTIARFAWASEAGYFSHELGLRNAFETRILWEDQTDQIHGFWQGEYLLQVPPEWADEARAQLRLLLEDKGEMSPDPADWNEPPDSPATFDPQLSPSIRWIPIVLTLTAGSVVAIGYQVWSRNEVRPAIAREQEDPEPAADGSQVIEHVKADGTRVTIELDQQHGQMVLTEDFPDQRPDRRRVFQAAR